MPASSLSLGEGGGEASRISVVKLQHKNPDVNTSTALKT